MALLFQSSDYLTAGTAVTASAPLTMACWFKPANPVTGVLMSISDSGVASRNHRLQMLGNGRLRAESAGGGVFGRATSVNTYSGGEWSHAVAVITSNSQRSVYLNGVRTDGNSNNAAVGNLDTTAIGRVVSTGSPLNVAGVQIAEAGIWSAVLSDAEIVELSLGRSPLGLTNRLGELRLCHELLRSFSRPLLGPLMAVQGTPVASPHPPVWSPGGQQHASRLRSYRRYFTAASHAGTTGPVVSQSFTAGIDTTAGQTAGEVFA